MAAATVWHVAESTQEITRLAPDIQEEIFFLPPVTEGRPAISERHLRQVLKTVVWSEQRERWVALRQKRQ